VLNRKLKDINLREYYYHLLNKETTIALNMFNARSKIIKKDDVSSPLNMC